MREKLKQALDTINEEIKFLESSKVEEAFRMIKEYCFPTGPALEPVEFLSGKRTKEDRRITSLHIHERVGRPYYKDGGRSLHGMGEFNVPPIGQINIDDVLSDKTLDQIECEALSFLDMKLKRGL